jgi:hypothetical protein
MRTEFADLLRKNTPEEHARKEAAIIRLASNEDFQILVRHWNSISPLFAAIFAGDTPEKAAARDGAKGHLREIFGVLMTASAVEKPKRSRKQKIDEPTK